MFKIITLIMLFLLFLYIYTFLKIRKNKRKRELEPSFVEQYHKNYSIRKLSAKHSNHYLYSQNASEIKNYVTKYNSPVDYVERKIPKESDDLQKDLQ